MATLINGKITKGPIAKNGPAGDFQRPPSNFLNSPSEVEIQSKRFHLFISYACPWAHRTLIARNLLGLAHHIDISVADPFMGELGWTFTSDKDPQYLYSLYVSSKNDYTGKVTVPVLWDTEKRIIVNNESSEILRILNSSFSKLSHSPIDLYPKFLREKIDAINERIYHTVNNGVYKTGFASTQTSYEDAFDKLFHTLDEMEILLKSQSYLCGEYFTEADVRFFTTLIRFDVVYYGHFKCNKKRISDYPHLYNYLKAIYQVPEIRETCHFDHIKEHYYLSHTWINPTKIVPKGPELDLDSPHNRGDMRFWLKHHH